MKIYTTTPEKPVRRPAFPYLAKTPLGFDVIVTEKTYIYLHDGTVCNISEPNYGIEDLKPLPEGYSVTLIQE